MACKANVFQQYDFPPLQEEPIVFLKRFALAMLDNIAQNSQEVTLFRIIIGESGRFPELGRVFVQNVEKPNIDFLAQYFGTHPKLQIADPEVAARTFLGTLIHFMIVRDLLHGGDILSIERDRLIDSLLSLIFNKNEANR